MGIRTEVPTLEELENIMTDIRHNTAMTSKQEDMFDWAALPTIEYLNQYDIYYDPSNGLELPDNLMDVVVDDLKYRLTTQMREMKPDDSSELAAWKENVKTAQELVKNIDQYIIKNI